jgi:hypothetical protein
MIDYDFIGDKIRHDTLKMVSGLSRQEQFATLENYCFAMQNMLLHYYFM